MTPERTLSERILSIAYDSEQFGTTNDARERIEIALKLFGDMRYEQGRLSGIVKLNNEDSIFYNQLKPFTPDFLSFLLVNALRSLNDEQRHDLTMSLAVSDRLFSIDEYRKIMENRGD